MSRMSNLGCQRLLQARGLTVQTLADALGTSRSHLSQVLANKPAGPGQAFGTGRGGRTRTRVIKYFQAQHAADLPGLLAVLGWNERGGIVPRGTPHVERS
jgi:hypothetical protein